ncbi:MAG: DUF1295 domain-containing protein [Halieaceae bacterium]
MKGWVLSLLGIVVSVSIATAMAVAGSQGGVSVAGIPLFALCGVVAFSIQWLLFFPAYLFQTEKFYDLAGSITYISLALIAVGLSGHNDAGSLLIAGMVIVWAARLGSFLFIRIMADGEDSRFASIKPDALRFLMTWTLQGLWVFITFSAGLAAITSAQAQTPGLYAALGASMWLVGFIIEVVADQQKRNFRKLPENRDRFINQGLWRCSRHPNYFGEILLWCGVAVSALPLLSGWQYLTLVSPCFVYLLLTQVSGVKMLEARARRRWGEDPDYQAYLRQTPALLLNPWRLRRTSSVR